MWDKNGKDAQSVDYSRLTALLIEAVKQQQKEIDEQARLIRAQQRRIAAQQRRMNAQEKLTNAQQQEISRLNRAVGAVKVSQHSAEGPKSEVMLASRAGQ